MVKLENSNCDETQKLKWGWNSESQTVNKLKNSNCDEPQNLKIVRKPKNSNSDKTQVVTKLKNSNGDKTHKL